MWPTVVLASALVRPALLLTAAVDAVAALEPRAARTALYGTPERAAATSGEVAAAAAAVARAAADVGCEREAMATWIGCVRNIPRRRRVREISGNNAYFQDPLDTQTTKSHNTLSHV